MYTVVGSYLSCYNWEDGDRIELIDPPETLKEDELYHAYNYDKKERASVLPYQIKISEEKSPIDLHYDRLKLQIDNLRLMHLRYLDGQDQATSIYWQNETIHEFLKVLEEETGADKKRKEYEETFTTLL